MFIKRSCRHSFLLLAGLACSTAGIANQFSYDAFISKYKSLNPKISIQAGGFWASQGNEQHININGLIGDDFSVTHQDNSNGLFGLGYYLDGYTNQYFDLSYGVNAFYLAKTSVSGDVTQEGLFTNLSYSYSVTNWPIYFGAKADLKSSYKKVNLTLDAGIGPNIIQTSHFGEKSLDNGVTIPDNIFSGHTTAAFSAMAGVGLKFHEIFGKAPLECGYRFFYLGQGDFNKVTSQVGNRLNTGDSYANAVLCSITV